MVKVEDLELSSEPTHKDDRGVGRGRSHLVELPAAET